MKTLLIGSSGYIGSETFKHLEDVVGVDCGIVGEVKNTIDINTNYDKLKINEDIDVVVLLAGYNSPYTCRKNLNDVLENNVNNFVKLLDRLDGKKLVYASSVCVYGNTSKDVVSEDDSYGENIFDNYGLSKVMIDKISEIRNLKNIFSLRFGTVVGASDNMRWNLMLNKMMYDGITKNKITIKNKNSKKPILYIKDCVTTIKQIVEKNVDSGFYNVVSHNSTVIEYANVVKNFLKTKGFEIEIEDLGDDNNYYSYEISTKKLCETINFCPTPYEDILENIYDSYYNCALNRYVEKIYSYQEIK